MSLPRMTALNFLLMPVWLLHGCASLEPEVEPDWRSPPETVKSLADTHARDDGSRVVIGNSRSVMILDGDDGAAVGAMGDESILDRIRVTVRMKGTPLAATLRPGSHNTLLLDEAGVLLVLDYEGTREQITALDVDTGDRLWQLDDFNYSIQQYEETLRRATAMAADKLAAALRGRGSGESIIERRERQRHFARGLGVAVDGGDAIVFKTFNGLVKLDAASGRERWRVNSFNGPGILDLQQLSNGDYLVLSRGRDLSRLQAASAYHLARISPGGKVRWISEHGGKETRRLQVAGNRAFVDGEPLEVFSLANGERLWSGPEGWGGDGEGGTATDPRYRAEPDLLMTDAAVYQVANTHGEDGEFLSTGFPHRVRCFDAATGELNWETGESSTYYGELKRVGNRLIVWGAGEFFGEGGGGGAAALDRQTGELLWRTPEMTTPGTISRANRVVEPVFDSRRDHLFIAGPEVLYGVRVNDGTTVLRVDLERTELGASVGLVRHGGNIVVIGEKGVAAFDSNSGDKVYEMTTHPVVDFHRYGGRLFLEVTASMLDRYRKGGSDEIGLVGMDPGDGSLGDLIAWKSELVGVAGVFADGRPFVTRDGDHVFVVDEEGRLLRYSP